jgi:1-acyl-sn-glycerol-3-phosphate acyltransferase
MGKNLVRWNIYKLHEMEVRDRMMVRGSGHGQKQESNYNHSRLERRRGFLRWMVVNIGFRFVVKLDRVEGLENFPAQGPAILIINHVAFFDPMVVIGCLPRNVVPMAKEEGCRHPIWGPVLNLWEVIPVKRGEVDRRALHKALQVLASGEVLMLAPEGTRNPYLRRAKMGLAYLGHRSGAPIIPVALEGTQEFPTINPARWRQPGVVVRLGKPFHFQPIAGRLPRERLRQMTDEAMYKLAALLPTAQRGVYANLNAATTETIDYV